MYGGSNNIAVKKNVLNSISKQTNMSKSGFQTKSSLAPIHYASL